MACVGEALACPAWFVQAQLPPLGLVAGGVLGRRRTLSGLAEQGGRTWPPQGLCVRRNRGTSSAPSRWRSWTACEWCVRVAWRFTCVSLATTPCAARPGHAQEYWESLLTGSNQSRETIRVAADCAMTGDYDSATAILQAVDFRTAGTLAVVWDSRGNQYNLPTYVYSRPRNVLSAEEAAAMHRQVQAHVGPVVDVPVVVRLSSSKTTLEQDIPLTLRSDNTISEVKGALHEELLTGSHDKKEGSDNTWAGVGLPPARQRVIYNGREMVDGHHLQQCGVAPGSFLQVFIRMPLHPAAGGQGAAS